VLIQFTYSHVCLLYAFNTSKIVLNASLETSVYSIQSLLLVLMLQSFSEVIVLIKRNNCTCTLVFLNLIVANTL